MMQSLVEDFLQYLRHERGQSRFLAGVQALACRSA